MVAENPETGRVRYIIRVVKVLFALISFPLLPLAVAFNVLGTADRLNFLPGIKRGGGVAAGVVAFVYVFTVIGVVAGGGLVASGSYIPPFGYDEPEPTPIPDPTPTELPTTTPIPTPMTSPLPSSTPVPTPEHSTFEPFEADYRSWVNETWEFSNLTDVPVLATEYRENEQGDLIFWVVFWECDFAQSEVEQWITVTNGFSNTTGTHTGVQPDGLRVYGVTNLTNFEDEVTYIPSSEAEAVYARDMSVETYTENWVDRMRSAAETEREIAYQMSINDSGEDMANLAFNVNHEDDDAFKCNGGAEPWEGSDDYDRHVENTAS